MFDAQLIRWVVWVGLVMLTVTLLLLIRTRWGQSQPLGKCVVLSLLAHMLLAIYISTVNIVTATDRHTAKGKACRWRWSTIPSADADSEPDQRRRGPWETFADPSLDETLTARAGTGQPVARPKACPRCPSPSG